MYAGNKAFYLFEREVFYWIREDLEALEEELSQLNEVRQQKQLDRIRFQYDAKQLFWTLCKNSHSCKWKKIEKNKSIKKSIEELEKQLCI